MWYQNLKKILIIYLREVCEMQTDQVQVVLLCNGNYYSSLKTLGSGYGNPLKHIVGRIGGA